jgi:hypothetical protein
VPEGPGCLVAPSSAGTRAPLQPPNAFGNLRSSAATSEAPSQAASSPESARITLCGTHSRWRRAIFFGRTQRRQSGNGDRHVLVPMRSVASRSPLPDNCRCVRPKRVLLCAPSVSSGATGEAHALTLDERSKPCDRSTTHVAARAASPAMAVSEPRRGEVVGRSASEPIGLETQGCEWPAFQRG